MTLAQLQEQVATLKKTIEELEQIVKRFQKQVNDEFDAFTSSSEEQKEGTEDDLIPGAEYDLVITVPPYESIYFQGKIVSIQEPPAELGLSDEDWANYASEDEDE